MKSRDFRGVLHAQPFCPFTFSTIDGATYTVDHAEDAWLAPDGRAVSVLGEGESLEILDAGQITDIEPGRGAPPATRS
jgi:hypothetical protein